MTAERQRAPIGHANANGWPIEAMPSPDLFDDSIPQQPHPSFLERLELFRRYGVEGLQRIAQQTLGRKPERKGPSTQRPRHDRPEPADSRQYAQPMATTAARDDRLTPNAKAFLQVLRARCANSRFTEITKGTMGNVMSRHPRTIQRYLVDLERFGYIKTEIRRTVRGLHTGLRIWITELTTPFYLERKKLGAWLASTGPLPFDAGFTLNARETLLPSRNQTPKNLFSSNTDTTHKAGREELLRKRSGEIQIPI
ncbi:MULTISPECIES: helix-turn-helix domain-containing protein [unclassified Aurantimonas]|uniref:helix-turn-helix domain-containing protein n=1 Tax=unclassified Aurantimonas TaxID=2638230 RepID=UPI002E176C87|nr:MULTISPECIES: helix-turn-helix domain-containing protein [unclassified Aurantimonas]MEC5293500.1 helix-turn-helix domain-containing protein [Aurantimonas sp. C2-3-R2]MEC5414564.1 helix-turn-helix domain-containing protein [Aurantimonas sp. C2-4-R8]